MLTFYSLGQRLQFDFPFFLYLLQHFFFLSPQAISQFITTHGLYKEGGSVFCIKLFLLNLNKEQKYKKKIPIKGILIVS